MSRQKDWVYFLNRRRTECITYNISKVTIFNFQLGGFPDIFNQISEKPKRQVMAIHVQRHSSADKQRYWIALISVRFGRGLNQCVYVAGLNGISNVKVHLKTGIGNVIYIRNKN